MLAVLLAATLMQVPDVVPVRRLAGPEASLAREFSQIRGVRELPDGRVLVADRLDEIVLVADLRTGAVRQLARKGPGPAEYQLPGTLLPLPGDSTLLLDEGNNRLAVIGPDLKVARSVSSQRPGMSGSVTPRGTDRAGRVYFEIPTWAQPGAAPNDSVIVARWDPRTDRIERLGRVRGITYRLNTRVMGIPYVVFAPQDVWQVDGSGRIAFVRSAGYRVEWRDPASGRISSGPATPYRPLTVTRGDRSEYVTRFVLTSSISGRGTGGVSAMPSSMTTPEAIAAMVTNQEFAPVRPPFTDTAPRIAPDGMLWVERSVASGVARTFDLFDGAGRRVSAVALPAGRRLIAFGRETAYLVATDADGVERLERYRLPPHP